MKDKLEKIDLEKTYIISCVANPSGEGIYINDYRVAGNKPFGWGHEKWQKKLRLKDVINAIPELKKLYAEVSNPQEKG